MYATKLKEDKKLTPTCHELFLVLTKSSKYSGYCVAGIDCKSGNWIRLITEDLQSHGAVWAEDLIYKNGRECQILDIIEFEL